MGRSMNKINYSDLDKWNDYFIGNILDNYADEIKNAKSYSEKEAIKKRYIKLVKLQVINFGDIMENETFARCVEQGGFMSYDGFGYYMNSIGEESKCCVSFNPDEIRSRAEDFPYVAWYNK